MTIKASLRGIPGLSILSAQTGRQAILGASSRTDDHKQQPAANTDADDRKKPAAHTDTAAILTQLPAATNAAPAASQNATGSGASQAGPTIPNDLTDGASTRPREDVNADVIRPPKQ